MWIQQQIDIAEKQSKGKKGISFIRKKIEDNNLEYIFIESNNK